MQKRYVLAATVLVAILGFLGFRIVNLEQRVDALVRQLDGPARAETRDKSAADAGTHELGYQQRLAALQKQVQGLKGTVQLLEKTSGSRMPGPHADEQILSVVEAENSRVRDVQLEWSRSRWLDTRKGQLTVFAHQNNLTPEQTASLEKVLEREVDAMVEILRRPNLAEDPDSASDDWKALLDETDQAAAKVMSGTQIFNWIQARTFERRLLWPWLPNKDLNK